MSLFSVFFVIFFLTFYIWHQAESVSIGYKTKDLENEIESLNDEIEQLEIQKADLLSLDRVEQMAKQELRMVLPSDEQIIFEKIDEDSRQMIQ